MHFNNRTRPNPSKINNSYFYLLNQPKKIKKQQAKSDLEDFEILYL